jgi:predicted AAA+ superfamily ATPase
MKERLKQVIDDALARDWPLPKRRSVTVKSHHDMISVLVGMRRTGKTWLCFQQIQDLIKQGIPLNRILYINFEDDRLTGITSDQLHWLTEFFYARHPDNREAQCYFFFDEIQNVSGWEKYVRRLLDTEKAHLTVTGSSAKLLSKEIATALRGRALTTEIFPLSFPEYGTFHDLPLPDNGSFGAAVRSKIFKAIDAYLVGGGFPAVQDMPTDIRREVLQSYVDVVLLRDIIERHGVTNVTALRELCRHLLQNAATVFSVTRFHGQMRAEGVACTRDTLHHLLGYLEDAYLVFPVPLHTRSAQRQRVNPRKLYLADTGLITSFSLGLTPDRGAKLENLVFLTLRRQGFDITYGRTTNGHEVDFVYQSEGQWYLLQVCWTTEQPDTREREIRALQAMECEHPGAVCQVITWMDEEEIDGIQIIPIWKWLLT